MRLLISGDRHYDDVEAIYVTLAGIIALNKEENSEEDIVLIEGGARGADSIAEAAGQLLGMKVLRYPAKWAKYGKAAGPIRNQQMLDEGKPDVVVCFHDDLEASRGTKHMASIAKKAGVPTYLVSKL